MDFFTLLRQIKEFKRRFSGPPTVVKVINLLPEGYGFLLKHKDEWFCLDVHLAPDHQGLWVSQNWEESTFENAITRTLNRLLRDTKISNIELFTKNGYLPDRVVLITLSKRDSFFASREIFYLIVELTGRVANLLLCDENMIVVELHRTTGNNSKHAQYKPPNQDGVRLAGFGEILACLGMKMLDECEINSDRARLEQVLSSPPVNWRGQLAGFSPLLTRELVWRCAAAGKEGERFERRRIEWETLLREAMSDSLISVYCQNGKLVGVVPVELRHIADLAVRYTFSTVDEAMAWVEEHVMRPIQLARVRDQVSARFAAELENRMRLREKLQADLERFKDGDRYKYWGNLLLANLHSIPLRATSVTLTDLETGAPVEIPLDPTRTPVGNAQLHFKMYKKALRGCEEVNKRLAEIDGEIAWLREQIWYCETASSFADLMSQLPRSAAAATSGASCQRQSSNAQKMGDSVDNRTNRETKEAARRIKPLLELDGCKFYVGRNGRQNDLITFALARKTDVWCHANDVPGSHVVVRRSDGPITLEDRRRGAILAAWFSFARHAGKVAVDVTEVAHVRRIPGGGPGRVSYTHQKTFYVDPAEAKSLLEKGAADTTQK